MARTKLDDEAKTPTNEPRDAVAIKKSIASVPAQSSKSKAHSFVLQVLERPGEASHMPSRMYQSGQSGEQFTSSTPICGDLWNIRGRRHSAGVNMGREGESGRGWGRAGELACHHAESTPVHLQGNTVVRQRSR